ncbi:nitroreductase family deazaflavin-dependent oxidoreductase [Nocardia sp. NBC_01503]|uniref:nitroreductase family deazaflavin-dependent oxidoreductase n=1 Tax=Nocardia sp. NBC_01503 TaxID=2975997 RepID=UPI002E7B9F9A|nr:nitroreductase family deazaflavin-dependent oxidoreductase [Nocardia sp. NBC_01503]WTL33106.1 nitroreductase family deazaflavin-dependent oxidoreductase [Nocardia sp. NBC_01503]
MPANRESEPTERTGKASPALHDPLPLASGQVLPNRLMKSALSEGLGNSALAPDERLQRLYARWSTGGYGLIVTGNVMVDGRHLGEPGNVAIEDERHLEALTRWAKAGKDGGSKLWMQLNHPGRQANPLVTRNRAVAPSAIGMSIPGVPAPRALTEDEILDIIGRFGTAARVAEAAGFDGVQIHGAHGYLVSQFLSPLSNQRTDAWGGDAERRRRFVLEVARSIRAAVSPGFGVGIKLNSADFQRGGFTEDESRAVIEKLSAEQLDLIEISGGSYESPAMLNRPRTVAASTKAREAYFLEYAESARAAAGAVPIAVTGGFRSRGAMIEAIAEGNCDMVGLGRPAAVIPSAAADLLNGAKQLYAPAISLRLPARLAANNGLKAFDGALDLQWHTDQLHLLGAGNDPDLDRSPWRTAVTMLRRNGFDALRSKRSASTPTPDRTAAKFRRERALGRYVMNPTVRALSRVGLRTALATEIETIGRKTGQPRRVPVSILFDDQGAWAICQHGSRSGWGKNLAANPEIRVRQGNTWRTGTAVFLPEDDVVTRAATFAPHPLLAPIATRGFAALETNPVTVRITFTDN